MSHCVDDELPDAATLGEPPPLDEVLDDLAMRFVVNCPAEEQESFERLLFQVEAAFWFYEDQYKEIWPHAFPTLNLFTFAQQLFKTCPMLKGFASQTKQIYDAFMSYKLSIPTCGAIILNSKSDKILLIKSWKGTNWGFPKGKIDKDEEKVDCAIREVLEEVGYDISERIRPDVYIEHQWKEQTVRLYVVAGVPDDTAFQTRTKKEISDIAWHKLKEIPTTREDSAQGKSKFWMVVPFANKLRRLLTEQKKAEQQKKAQKGQKAPPPAAEPPKQDKQKGPPPATAPPPSAEPPPLRTASKGQAGVPNTAPLGSSRGKGRKGNAGSAAAPSTAPPSSVQVLMRAGSDGAAVPSRGHPFLDFRFNRQVLVDALGRRGEGS